METTMDFTSYVRAAYPFLLIQTFEGARAIKALSEQLKTNEKTKDYAICEWDLVAGYKNYARNDISPCEDPFEALKKFEREVPETILFVHDFPTFLKDTIVVRKCLNLIPIMESSFRHIVILTPVIDIPIELEKAIQVIDFNLPTAEELEELANTIAKDNGMEFTIGKKEVEAAKGLTMDEAKNTFSRSLIETKTYDRKIIEQSKLQTVKKSGLMEIYEPVPIEAIGGLDVLKAYIQSRKRGFIDDALPTPKGILLAGTPGSGKSLTAKATASILGMPLIRLDLGTLKGGLVGESEKNMKMALSMIDAISPCVVWLDEIEKSLSGVASSGKTDGGTGSNMFGQLLTWMQESTTMKYIVATCNDMDELLSLSQGALIRRFDDIFFVDLPGKNERKQILKIMTERYKAESLNCKKVNMEGWTGAEIEKFVINALYDGVELAAKNVHPIAVQNKATIDKAREWAKYNAIRANEDVVEVASGRSLKI